jgi:hypothetical protein
VRACLERYFRRPEESRAVEVVLNSQHLCLIGTSRASRWA